MDKDKLSDLRNEIDSIDSVIIDMLNKRAKVSIDIGKIKQENGEPIYDPERENKIYEAIKNKNKGVLKSEVLLDIYSEIISGCRLLQVSIKVAYLGPEFTFTHQAALKKFGSNVDYISCNSIFDVFKELEKNNVEYGIVPFENSTQGSISDTLDMFINSNEKILSEIYFPVFQSFLSKEKDIKSIKKIYSKFQVFGQCKKWLQSNIPWAELCETDSTSKAASIVAEESNSACIASSLVAKKYNLEIMYKSIEDNSNNTTRFIVIGKDVCKVTGNDKTSILFSIEDKPGALYDVLCFFKNYSINLTKIESRPSKEKAWKYYFFIDILGHFQDENIIKVFEDLSSKCSFFKVLGSYPRG